jgi:hypothetical protein
MKKITTLIILVILLTSTYGSCSAFSTGETAINIDKTFIKLKTKSFQNVFQQNNISIDLQVREQNGEWIDDILTAYIDTIIEFQLKISTNRGYPLSLSAAVSLPKTDEGPLFDFIENSQSSTKKTTYFEATNEDVVFLWLPLLFPSTITCSFKAKLVDLGKNQEILSIGVGIIDDTTIDYTNDTTNITSQPTPIPYKPNTPQGPTNGFINEVYRYTSSTTDPYNLSLFYRFNWGDGSTSDWIGPYPSGEEVTLNHSWEKSGTYSVRVQAKNDGGLTSDWSSSIRVSIEEKVILIKPSKGLYLGNGKIVTLPFTLIIGSINVQVETPGFQNQPTVYFYVNDKFQYEDTKEPYSWFWDDAFFGNYELRVSVSNDQGDFEEIIQQGFKIF